MTQPQSQGFPDYQRNRPAQNVVYETFAQAINGVTQRGPFFCGYFSSTRFRMTQETQHTTIIVNWFNNQAGAVLLGSSSLTTQQNDNVDIAFPNQGPWFTYSIVPNATPDTVSVTVSAVAYVGGPGLQEANNVLIDQENTAIGAGVTLSNFTAQLWPGAAMLNVNCSQRPYRVSLAGTTITGARAPFFQWDEAAQAGLMVPVFLPASVVRILITNNAAAPGTVSFSIVADPWPRPAIG